MTKPKTPPPEEYSAEWFTRERRNHRRLETWARNDLQKNELWFQRGWIDQEYFQLHQAELEARLRGLALMGRWLDLAERRVLGLGSESERQILLTITRQISLNQAELEARIQAIDRLFTSSPGPTSWHSAHAPSPDVPSSTSPPA